jgi:hypothetical protein
VGILLIDGRTGLGGGRRPAPGRLACVLTAALALVGCAGDPTHANGTVVCDVRIPTGAMAASVRPLQNPGPAPASGPAPAASELPPAVSPPPDYLTAVYLHTSPDCEHGAVVVVQPAENARLVVSVPAADGGVAALGLEVSGPVTVQSWVAGAFAGSASLP